MIADAQTDVRHLLADNRDRLGALVRELLKHETLDEPDAYAATGLPTTPKNATAVPS